ncbi:hypothetical protein [Aureispira sp. CCB-QB1]|uniref:hypothetical protein n=1 Tax=Aureispira sp. CCB-QB1 TaxID=1313421 RepID=UPI000697B0B0|nr:hypothetical protein [Aureispira sp. CCB-QB1]
MSAEMYNVSLYEAHSSKKTILTKKEVWELCQHYNQHNEELERFLEQFDFDEWACVGIDIDAVYYEHTKDGKMDCSAAEFLGIMLTSLHDDKFEMAFKRYQKSQNPDEFSFRNIPSFELSKDIYDETSDTYKVIARANSFNVIEGCPLWVVRVDSFSDYRLAGVVLIPTKFWDSNALMYESAGYGYTIKDRNWYRWESAIPYRMNRVGKWSPNFLESMSTLLPTQGEPYQYDAAEERFFKMPSHYGKKQPIEYYDLKSGAWEQVEGFDPVGMSVQDGLYHIYTKKGLIKTNKNFEKLEKLDSKTGLMGNTVLQEYTGKGWSVVLTSKGIDIQSFKTQKKDKLSAFKIKAGDARGKRLLIYAIDKEHLVLLNDKLMLVDADLNLTVHSLKKSFKKELEPLLGKSFIGVPYVNGGIDVPNRAPFFFLNNLVISLDEKMNPIVMNSTLEKLTGEFNFYGAVPDSELEGMWMLAGLERLVFLKNNLKEAFVFNTAPRGSVGGGKYPFPWIHLDQGGNLRYALSYHEKVRIITRDELRRQLKTATAYSTK